MVGFLVQEKGNSPLYFPKTIFQNTPVSMSSFWAGKAQEGHRLEAGAGAKWNKSYGPSQDIRHSPPGGPQSSSSKRSLLRELLGAHGAPPSDLPSSPSPGPAGAPQAHSEARCPCLSQRVASAPGQTGSLSHRKSGNTQTGGAIPPLPYQTFSCQAYQLTDRANCALRLQPQAATTYTRWAPVVCGIIHVCALIAC